MIATPTMLTADELDTRWRELSAAIDLCHDGAERAVLLRELREVEAEAARIIEGERDE